MGQTYKIGDTKYYIAGNYVLVYPPNYVDKATGRNYYKITEHKSTLRQQGYSSISQKYLYKFLQYQAQQGDKDAQEKLRVLQQKIYGQPERTELTQQPESSPAYKPNAPTFTLRGEERGTPTPVYEEPKYPAPTIVQKGTAAERLSYYRAVEQQKGYTPVGQSVGGTFGFGFLPKGTNVYGVGYRPESIQFYEPSGDVGSAIKKESAVKQLQTIFFTFPEKEQTIQEELSPSEQRTESLRTGTTLKDLEATYGYGVSDLGFLAPKKFISGFEQVTSGFGASFVSTVSAAIHPVETVKTTLEFGGKLIVHPFSTTKEVISGLHYHIQQKGLLYTAGEFGGYYLQGKAFSYVGGKAYAKSPVKIKYEKFKMPSGLKGEYHGIGLEINKEGYALIGLGEETGITVGTPKLQFSKADLSKGFISETSIGRSIIKKSIKGVYPEEEVLKFIKYGKIQKATETVPSAFVQKKFISETKTLSPKGVKKVLEFAREEEAELYGSFPARQQLPKDLAIRTPADIDIQLKVGEAEAIKKADVLVKELRSVGEDVRRAEGKALIEVKGKDKMYHHAVDIHSSDIPMAELTSPALAQEGVYGFKFGQESIKLQGVKIMPLSEQGVRKGASIFTLREGKFFPEAHRTKDIVDFFTTQEALARSLGGIKGQRVLTELKELKGLYPKELFETSEKLGKDISKKYVEFQIKKGDVGHISIEPKLKSGQYVKLYHGTTRESYEQILKEGLKKDIESRYKKGFKEPYISTTLSKEVAEAYAGESGKVITTEIPIKDFKRMWQKGEVFQDPFSTGIGEPNLAFSKNIPQKWIKQADIPQTTKTLIYSPQQLKSGSFVSIPFKTPKGAFEKRSSSVSIREASPSLRAYSPPVSSPKGSKFISSYSSTSISSYSSPSLRKSISPSASISPSKSPSPSPSKSPSPSPSPYTSPSPSPPSRSVSISPSPSPYTSPSPSPPSRSVSISPSPSPYTSPSPYYTTKITKIEPFVFKGKDQPTIFRGYPIRPIRQPKVLTPTGRASLFSLKGRTTQAGIKTGLGERYINVPKKKKKKVKSLVRVRI